MRVRGWDELALAHIRGETVSREEQEASWVRRQEEVEKAMTAIAEGDYEIVEDLDD